MSNIIEIAISDKIATQTNDVYYICGNSGFLVEFSFDEEWKDYNMKTARFVYGNIFKDVVFEGNTCSVPVIEDTFCIMVGVFAGNLQTTTAACVNAKKSILCGGGTPAAPSNDVYSQIMELLNKGGGGSVVPDEDVATDEEVNDMFGDVFWGEDTPSDGGATDSGSTTPDEDIATDEEVDDMFDDIFGNG